MQFKKVKNYGSQVGYCKEGVRISFKTHEEYNDACRALVAADFEIGPFDNCYQYITLHKADAEKVRVDTKRMCYWNKETGERLAPLVTRLITLSKVIDVLTIPPEEQP